MNISKNRNLKSCIPEPEFSHNHCNFFKKGHHCEEYIIDVFHRLYGYLKQYDYIETITNEKGEKEETVKKWGDIKVQYYPHFFSSNKILDYIID